MSRFGLSLVPGVLLAFAVAGCHSNPSPTQPQTVSSEDPAAVNLAPASDTSENPPLTPSDQASQDQASQDQADQNPNAAPPPSGDQYGSDQSDQGYDDTAEDVAPQPPPPIPDYDQPPAPSDDYEWTPGYWAYASDGYYWVPGEWVLAPWIGALWTPGYWGFDNGRYDWHHGYWGPHVGFYGGVNYGYGYDGDGYEGGYWRANHFYYNTAVTHVNHDIRDVYDYRVSPRNNSRVSYNGGHGGLDYRPNAAQQAAQRERHVPLLPSQRTSAQNAQHSQGQFERNNHGHPQTVAETRPMNDGRTAPAARPEAYRQTTGNENGRNGAAPPIAHQPARTSPQPFNRPGRQTEQPNHPSPTVNRPNREPNPSYHPQSPGNRRENPQQPQPNQQPHSYRQPQPSPQPNRQPQPNERSRPNQRTNPNEPRSSPAQRTVEPQRQTRTEPTPRNTSHPGVEPHPATQPRQQNPAPREENRQQSSPREQPHQEQQRQEQPHQQQQRQEQPHQQQQRQEQPHNNPDDNHPHGSGAA